MSASATQTKIALLPDPLDEEQRSLQQSIVTFAQRELGHDLDRRDHEGDLLPRGVAKVRAAWALGHAGAHCLRRPRRSGHDDRGGAGRARLRLCGQRADLLDQRPDVGLRATDRPLRHRGAEAPLAARTVRRLADRRARDDRAGIGLRCLRAANHRDAGCEGGWLLNGSKTFVTNAPDSDLFIVFATTDRSLGFAGLCAFVRRARNARPGGGRALLEDGPAHVAPGRAVPQRLPRPPTRCSASRAAGWRSSTPRCAGSAA